MDPLKENQAFAVQLGNAAVTPKKHRFMMKRPVPEHPDPFDQRR
ncbi:hypothetical protein [Cupriavidus pauculus]|nr:hypothetical protein [Cupriavidus pauculus]